MPKENKNFNSQNNKSQQGSFDIYIRLSNLSRETNVMYGSPIPSLYLFANLKEAYTKLVSSLPKLCTRAEKLCRADGCSEYIFKKK